MLTALLLSVGLLVSCQPTKPDPVVIMLSLDGFRWDYPQFAETPNIDRMAVEGVRAASLQPAYPSKTFPNHYTMATGLYPDHHGIVQNNFYDPELDRVFRISDRSAVQDSVFWGGEPIWETAERQGLRTASYFWVGSESNDRYHPTQRKMYDHGFPMQSRIDSVISWLYLPQDQRPRLIVFYYHEPDGAGHDFGPLSPQVADTVAMLDGFIGEFRKKLSQAQKDLNLAVNFILVSDHGMGYIPEGKYTYLDEVIDLNRITRVHGGNPVYQLYPESGYYEEALMALQQTPNIKVFEKHNLPAHYHYGTHPRIGDIVVEADSAWGLAIERRDRGYSAGTHGYDPRNTDMHGIFYAVGPAFKKGHVHPTFEHVHLYALIASILRLDPASNDSSLDQVKDMLAAD